MTNTGVRAAIVILLGLLMGATYWLAGENLRLPLGAAPMLTVTYLLGLYIGQRWEAAALGAVAGVTASAGYYLVGGGAPAARILAVALIAAVLCALSAVLGAAPSEMRPWGAALTAGAWLGELVVFRANTPIYWEIIAILAAILLIFLSLRDFRGKFVGAVLVVPMFAIIVIAWQTLVPMLALT
ncbi:hypothetical protein [Streptosporangium sp. NPDC000396]|uniref:hypothetical protein n=1 Tax=Streptosporangium sp. NPDC000396 TaxID=3366185 RepID=UPI0036BC6A16